MISWFSLSGASRSGLKSTARRPLGMSSLDFGDEAIEVLDERVNRGRDWGVTVGFADNVENTFKNSYKFFKPLKLVRRDDSLILCVVLHIR